MTARRICYVLGTAAAGTGYHTAMLAEGCAGRGMQVTVYGPAGTGSRFFPAGASGIRFGVLEISDRPRPARDAAAVLRLRRRLAAETPDVVHAHGTRAGAFAGAALRRPWGRRGAARRGPALVVTMHNAPPAGRLAGLVYRFGEHVIARRADVVLCASGDLADRMQKLGARGVGRAVVPSPATAPPSAAAVRQAREDIGAAGRPVVLAAGRLAAQKGFGVLLDAAAAWQDAVPRPLVVIAGDGPLAGELKAAAQQAGTDAVFLGARRDVPALLATADVVAVPSMWEARALIVQEALMAGRPLVASRVGGIPELTGEDGAMLVPPSDAGQLAAAILAVLRDPALAGRLATVARARAAALPSEADAVSAVIAVYERLAAESHVLG